MLGTGGKLSQTLPQSLQVTAVAATKNWASAAHKPQAPCCALRLGTVWKDTTLGTTYMVQPNSPCPFSLEYAENIGDGRSPEFRETEQKRILALLENF